MQYSTRCIDLTIAAPIIGDGFSYKTMIKNAIIDGKIHILKYLLTFEGAVATLATGDAVAVAHGSLEMLNELLKHIKEFDNISNRCLYRLLQDSKVRKWLQEQNNIPVSLKSVIALSNV